MSERHQTSYHCALLFPVHSPQFTGCQKFLFGEAREVSGFVSHGRVSDFPRTRPFVPPAQTRRSGTLVKLVSQPIFGIAVSPGISKRTGPGVTIVPPPDLRATAANTARRRCLLTCGAPLAVSQTPVGRLFSARRAFGTCRLCPSAHIFQVLGLPGTSGTYRSYGPRKS